MERAFRAAPACPSSLRRRAPARAAGAREGPSGSPVGFPFQAGVLRPSTLPSESRATTPSRPRRHLEAMLGSQLNPVHVEENIRSQWPLHEVGVQRLPRGEDELDARDLRRRGADEDAPPGLGDGTAAAFHGNPVPGPSATKARRVLELGGARCTTPTDPRVHRVGDRRKRLSNRSRRDGSSRGRKSSPAASVFRQRP